ncbi:hypothetical protein [Flavobacterium sp. NKUCC04_CG]|uniref:hypothetical protein n=1 Tax=Flavobacterium sp. NKUCC04_CG TaxID=2842121 RepID=UPI001C5B4033|nr:hypothetical protein [Flavobacterium sp. NKUCC04_CG]MBW3517835.1 hypothetical protein [Flavobacterium sp. NKUCC04_CG]
MRFFYFWLFLGPIILYGQEESEGRVLDDIVISVDSQKDKKELTAILKNSYKLYDADNFYEYDTFSSENNSAGRLLESDKGFFKKNSFYNMVLLVSEAEAEYDISDSVPFVSLMKYHYFMFSSKSNFKLLLKAIDRHKVHRVDEFFYLYDDDWNYKVVFEVDLENRVLTRFVNNGVSFNEFEVGDNIFFKRDSQLVERALSICYEYNGKLVEKEVVAEELYEFKSTKKKVFKNIDIKKNNNIAIQTTHTMFEKVQLGAKLQMKYRKF